MTNERFENLVSAEEMMRGTTPQGLARGLALLQDMKKQELASRVIAKYKVQVNFGTNRTLQGPNKGVLTFWLSGSKLHGGGDEMLYLCREADSGSERDNFEVGRPGGGGGCGKFIAPQYVHDGAAMCPHCHNFINAAFLTGQIYFRATTRNVARAMAHYFRVAEHSADLVARFAQDDIRYQTAVLLQGAHKARISRGQLVYPLHRILRDVSGGAELEKRIYAMLTA